MCYKVQTHILLKTLIIYTIRITVFFQVQKIIFFIRKGIKLIFKLYEIVNKNCN